MKKLKFDKALVIFFFLTFLFFAIPNRAYGRLLPASCGNPVPPPAYPPPGDPGFVPIPDPPFDIPPPGPPEDFPSPTPTGSVTPTPTPTKAPPACNVSCVRDSDCEGARDFCTSCIDNKCQRPPTPTPTKPPPACNVACERPGDCVGAKDGCTSCIDRKCQAPPTPTPTLPPFSQDMCKCDGIELSPKEFGAGSKLTVTAYAKVEGSDVSYAEVAKILFSSGKGVDPNIRRDVPYEVPVAVQIIENTPNKVRYKAIWSYKVPDKIDPKLTYRIWADPVCVRKGEAGKISSSSQGIEVIPQTSSSNQSQGTSFFGNIWNFFRGLFGGSSNPNNSSTTQTIQSEEEDVSTTAGEDTLQLRTIGFGEVVGTDSCRYIKIRAKR